MKEMNMNRLSYCVIGSWLLAAVNINIIVHFIHFPMLSTGFDITPNNVSMVAPIVSALLALVCLFLAGRTTSKGDFFQRIAVIPPLWLSFGALVGCVIHVVLIIKSS